MTLAAILAESTATTHPSNASPERRKQLRDDALAELLVDMTNTDTPGVADTPTSAGTAMSSPWSGESEFSLPSAFSASPDSRLPRCSIGPGVRKSFASAVDEAVTVADMFPKILTNPLFVGFGEFSDEMGDTPDNNQRMFRECSDRRSSACSTPSRTLFDSQEDLDEDERCTPPNPQYGANPKRASGEESDGEWVDGWATGNDSDHDINLDTDDDNDTDTDNDEARALPSNV